MGEVTFPISMKFALKTLWSLFYTAVLSEICYTFFQEKKEKVKVEKFFKSWANLSFTFLLTLWEVTFPISMKFALKTLWSLFYTAVLSEKIICYTFFQEKKEKVKVEKFF